jgi:drug/metabolite transporter (DMT)-like permease
VAGVSYRAWGLACALGGVVGFSFRPILIKLCYAEHAVSPVTLLFLRMTMSLPFFVLVAWILNRRGAGGSDAGGSDKREPLTPRDWAMVGALGFTGYYLASFLDFIGLQYVGAGIGRLISFLYPTMVVLLSMTFLGRRPTAREIAALVISYAGIALVVSDQIALQPGDRLFLFGVLLCLANALAYAVYLVAGGELTRRIGSMRFTAYTMIAATVPAMVQFFVLEPLAALELPALVWSYMLVMVVFATIVPVFLSAEALRRIGANHFAVIGGVSPVVTVFAAAVGLEEPVTLLQVAGSILVISGVLLVSLKPKAA